MFHAAQLEGFQHLYRIEKVYSELEFGLSKNRENIIVTCYRNDNRNVSDFACNISHLVWNEVY